VLKEWAFERWEEREPTNRGPVKPVSWSRRWIPVLHNGAGDFLCVDLDPPADGRLGQVIAVYHDEPSRIRMARSHSSWLARFADRLDAGCYGYDEDEGFYTVRELSMEELIEP